MNDSGRKIVQVGESAWHYKIYQYTISHRGWKKKPGYRENLCHYMRAVLIWAPLLWFFVVPIEKGNKYLGWIRAWMIFVLVIILNYTWQWRSDIAHALGVAVEEAWLLAVAILGYIVFFMLGIYLTDRYKEEIKRFISWVAPYTQRLWGNVLRPPLAYMWLRMKLTWHLLTVELYGRYFLRSWMFIPFVAAGIGWWLDDDTTKSVLIELADFLLFVVVLLSIIGLIAALMFGLYKLFRLVLDRSLGRSVKAAQSGTSTPQIAWTYLTAKKAKICPFIILPGGRTQPALIDE